MGITIVESTEIQLNFDTSEYHGAFTYATHAKLHMAVADVA
jgi:hypothetical protein